MTAVADVQITPAAFERFRRVVGDERTDRLREAAERAREALGSARLWMVNSSDAGGGVAEMLQVQLPYLRAAGIDVRWRVVRAGTAFFRVTKRIHHGLHGSAGDGGPLDAEQYDLYRDTTSRLAGELAADVRPGDVVVLHDPQTAGMTARLVDAGARVAWRCHVGSDADNDYVVRAWDFLRPFLEQAEFLVFSRATHAPAWGEPRTRLIAPSIDPMSPKNVPLGDEAVRRVLATTGLIGGAAGVGTTVDLAGDELEIHRGADVLRNGPPPASDVPIIVQISRWDPLKDMQGVLEHFVQHIARRHEETHLFLVGPEVSGVSDDPEGQTVLEGCVRAWRRCAAEVRRRVHLVTLPMDSVEENAVMVNALQRHAAVVVQKSLAEGFGLTVAEAMWKRRPVVASAVGGINDQIVDGEHGLLLDDPRDGDAFGRAVCGLLDDPDAAAELGARAGVRAEERLLADRQIREQLDLVRELAA